jgi:hypothetical protein
LVSNVPTLPQHVVSSQIAIIANAGHWMFEQAPQEYCRIVTEFLARRPSGGTSLTEVHRILSRSLSIGLKFFTSGTFMAFC